jgi:hypothetical protein
MEQQLSNLQCQLHFAVAIIDVDSDENLSLRYGGKVPVLAHGEQEICHYFFNEDTVQSYLRTKLS